MSCKVTRTEPGFTVSGFSIPVAGVREWGVEFRLNEVVAVLDGHEDVYLMRKPSPDASSLFRTLMKGEGREVTAALFNLSREIETAIQAREDDPSPVFRR